MSAEDSDTEKTEEPTERKLQKARDDGQVARSRELTTFAMLLAGTGALGVFGMSLYNSIGGVMERAFIFDRARAFDTAVMLNHGASLGLDGVLALAPFMLVMAVVALIAPNLLSGPMISGKSLKPQFSKLNPAKGLKRMFSTQALVELLKVIAKSLLVGGVMTIFMMGYAEDFRALLVQSVDEALVNTFTMSLVASLIMVAALIVVVLIDVPYQLFDHTKKLRMTLEEVKREHKEAEGDPLLKSRIRSQQQAMARNRMMADVPEADAIVTNPTHFAVALKYHEDGMGAPIVVAKGGDLVSAKIREIGLEAGVPILEAPPLARALYYNVDIGHEIPFELYTAVAEVIAWAMSIRRQGFREFGNTAELPVPEEMASGRVRPGKTDTEL